MTRSCSAMRRVLAVVAVLEDVPADRAAAFFAVAAPGAAVAAARDPAVELVVTAAFLVGDAVDFAAARAAVAFAVDVVPAACLAAVVRVGAFTAAARDRADVAAFFVAAALVAAGLVLALAGVAVFFAVVVFFAGAVFVALALVVAAFFAEAFVVVFVVAFVAAFVVALGAAFVATLVVGSGAAFLVGALVAEAFVAGGFFAAVDVFAALTTDFLAGAAADDDVARALVEAACFVARAAGFVAALRVAEVVADAALARLDALVLAPLADPCAAVFTAAVFFAAIRPLRRSRRRR